MKKKIPILLFIVCYILALFGCAPNPEKKGSEDDKEENYTFNQTAYDAGLMARKNYLEEYLLTKHDKNYSAKFGFSVSAAKMGLYFETNDDAYLNSALLQARKCYEDFERSPDCFKVFFAAHHYGLFSQYYPEDLKTYAKEVFLGTTVYGDRPSTTNHALMFAVGTYLANQYFPGEITTEYYGYDAVQTDDPTAEKTLYTIANNYPITGVYESNSDTYFICHFLPLLAIAECSDDEVLAKKSMMALHNSIFTLAPVWLKGHISISKERCYQPYTSENEGGAATSLLWYYFGEREVFPTFQQLDEAESMLMGFVLYSDFLPHWISVAMAQDRSEAYQHFEAHIYTKDRYNTTFTNYMQSYMNQDYSVYSTRDQVSLTSLYVNRLRGFDRELWGVNWTTDDPNEKSNFSICHWDALVTDNHTKIGCTVYSEVLQHKETVIGVFDIPEEYDSRFPDYTYPRYITINMPTNYKMVIDESYKGIMYAHYGNLVIGFKLSVPFVYTMTDHINTVDITKAYFVCQVMDVDNLEGDTVEEQLLYFQSLLEASFRTIEFDFSGRTKVTYQAIDQTTMELQYSGDGFDINGIINGENIVYSIANWPSQSNPWISAKVGERVLTYTYKNHEITFDFRNQEIVEGLIKDEK